MDLSLRPAGFVRGGVRTVLRLEGLAVLAAAVTAYAMLHANWWLFAALFLAPDVSFVAYLANPRVGAIAYNSVHSYIAPLLLGFVAYFSQAVFLAPMALMWAAHIGFDRAIGYGLKYGSGFGDTHLGFKERPRQHATATQDIAT
jgi:hypothetical protein